MAKAIFKINYHPHPANAGGNSRENAKSIGLGFSPFEKKIQPRLALAKIFYNHFLIQKNNDKKNPILR